MKWEILIIVSLLLIAGCTTETQVETTNQQDMINDEKSMSSEIADSMTEILDLGQEAVCTATTDSNKSTIGIKDGKERIEFDTPQGKSVALFLGDVLYTWAEGESQGVIIDFEKLKELPDGTTYEETKSIDEINEGAENVVCENTKISDDLFEVPQDVEFIDLADMFMEMFQAFNQ